MSDCPISSYEPNLASLPAYVSTTILITTITKLQFFLLNLPNYIILAHLTASSAHHNLPTLPR